MTLALFSALRTAVGDAHVLTDGDLSAYTHDWRKREGGVPMPNSLITDGNAGEAAEWTPFQLQ